MTTLRELHIDRLDLTERPADLGALRELETPSIAFTKIATLPPACYELTKLRTLHVDDAQLTAAIDRTTGALLPWNPAPNSRVHALALSGDDLVVGGAFTTIGGQARHRHVSVDRATGSVTAWRADADDVDELVVHGTTLYGGGRFHSIAGQPRTGLVALDVDTAGVAPWNPGVNGQVFRLAVVGDIVYASGGELSFTSVGGQARKRLAAIDIMTGQPTSWDPSSTNRGSHVFAVANDTLYVGGSYAAIAGQPRAGLAAFDVATGALDSWSAAAPPGGGFGALAVLGTTLYASGRTARAFDTITGDAVGWFPSRRSTRGAVRRERHVPDRRRDAGRRGVPAARARSSTRDGYERPSNA